MLDLYKICTDLKMPHSKLTYRTNALIGEIYTITKCPSDRTLEVLAGWKEDFKYIYGSIDTNLSSNSKLNTRDLLASHGIFHEEEISDNEATQLLFFAIQTFFSLFIKLATDEVFAQGQGREERNYSDIILGKNLYKYGIHNYCGADWFCWPIFELDNSIPKVLNDIVEILSEYKSDMTIHDFVAQNNDDYIKQIYEEILPKELRHALGEYYTPDWMAEITLDNALGFSETPCSSAVILDPTCGSGTFLIKCIKRKRNECCSMTEIVKSVIGFDINPLAVLTAKTNYIFSLADLFQPESNIKIPIYNVDIINYGEIKETMAEVDLINTLSPVDDIRNQIKNDRSLSAGIQPVDIIVGNPPWVNWEYMPEKYRVSSQHKWIDYKLFNASGRDLSFSKEDISVLITYVVLDRLLKNNGILAFVIRQGVFKSAQNGVGFRRFYIRDDCPVKVLRVDDLSKIKAFDNATNSTAIFFAQKGLPTVFPVSYFLWNKERGAAKSFNSYSPSNAVLRQVRIEEQCAKPAVEDNPTSLWLTAAPDQMESLTGALGTNNYRARTGVFTGGANAVYWLDVLSSDGETVQVTNIIERAKRKVEKVTATLEKQFVYPMIKGSDVQKWRVKYDTYILCPHTATSKMWPVPHEEMERSTPLTYSYLSRFKEDLMARNGFAGWEKEIQQQEFHAILRIGDYTFSKYKVVWKYIATEFICAVISEVDDKYLGTKVCLPNEKIMYVSTESENEAFYLCGVLSSSLISNCVKGFMNPTSISAHVLDKLNIPDFDPSNSLHIRIAEYCKQGHSAENIEPYIKKIDAIINEIYS